MSLTKKQLEIIEALGESKTAYFFPKIDMESNSYMEEYDESDCSIRKLHFSTIPELINTLDTRERTVRSKKCDVLCAVEIFKNRPQYNEMSDCDQIDKKMELPEYIYNF